MNHRIDSAAPRTILRAGIVLTWSLLLAGLSFAQGWESGIPWKKPPRVAAGKPGQPPEDAVVLFDGTDLSKWTGGKWVVKDGVATVNGGSIQTKQSFGDCQLHLEFCLPENKQAAGNSGVYMMSRYEIQIWDSYNVPVYVDGMCGSIYKQSPPLVNVTRKPGGWQTYDIIFHAPRFDENGKLLKPAVVTVLQNGVLVQDHFELPGGTVYTEPPKYQAHPPKAPLLLQDHGSPVKFRNIWIRETPTRETPKPKEGWKQERA